MHLSKWRHGALACLLTASIAVQAEDKEMEEVVVFGELGRYSATKSDTPILEISRSVSIEGQQQLLDKGALNLADAYLYTAGVFGEQYGFATRGDWLSVRGLTVPEYRDSLQALFGNYNNTRPDIYTIEQVELLKGPASVLYGKGSPGGIVNLVSKTPKAESAHELVAEFGNFNRTQIGIDSTGSLDQDGKWLYRMIGLYRDSETQVDFIDDNVKLIAPAITWQPNDTTSLTFMLNIKDSESAAGAQFHHIQGTLNRAPNGRKIDSETNTGEPAFNKYDTKSTSYTLLADHQINDYLSIESTARITKGESDYQQAWASFIGGDRYIRNADGSLYKDGTVPRSFYIANNSSDQKAIDVRLRADFTTAQFDHEILFGIQYQDVETDSGTAYLFALGLDFATGLPDATLGDQFWINVFDPVYTGQGPDQSVIDLSYADAPTSTTKDLGLYLNDQINYQNFSITLGLRYDEVETRSGANKQNDYAMSYSAGVLYAFEFGLSPYVNYAESFEPVIGTDNTTGKILKPREGKQLEVGLKYQPELIPGAFISLAWFDIEQSNLDNPNALVGANSQQEGKADIRGTELEAIIPWQDFSLEFNASVLNTEDPDGFQFASVPEKQSSLWLGYRPSGFWPGFKTGLGVRYVGKSFDGADDIKTPSYTLIDLMVGYETEHWDLAINAKNINDKEYIATCLARGDCFIGENRSIVGRLRYKF